MAFADISGEAHLRNQEIVHRFCLSHGWYDKPVGLIEAMGLLITEVVEADDAWYEEGLLAFSAAPQHMCSEFADIYIRFLDYCLRFGANPAKAIDVYEHSYAFRAGGSFQGYMLQLVRRARDVIEEYRVNGLYQAADGKIFAPPGLTREFAYLYLQLRDTCEKYKVDLQQAFDLKMTVNEARPYRHGGKIA